MHLPYRWIACAAMLLASSASAGDLSVLVVDARSTPVADAVVAMSGSADGAAQASLPPVTKIIDQRHEAFAPYVEIFRPGDQVVFRNSDTTRHHVYSFAPAKSFEFVIAPGHSAPAVTLDQAGEIAVGCNIHDRMIAHLFISNAAHIVKTGSDGRADFKDLPDGRYSVRVWHPQLRPGSVDPEQTVQVEGNAANVTFSLKLLPDPRDGASDPERSHY